MQYLVSVIDDGTGLATPTEEADISAFNDRLRAEGRSVFAGGLGSPDPAVIDNRGGEAVFTDGPFLEAKEYLAGFGSSRPPTWTWRSARRRGSSAATGGRGATVHEQGQGPGGDRPGPPRGVGAGGRRPDQAISVTSTSPRRRPPRRSRPPSCGGLPTVFRPTPEPG